MKPDLVPMTTAARALDISRQAIYKKVTLGKIDTFDVYGEKWVSIKQIEDRKRRGRNVGRRF